MRVHQGPLMSSWLSTLVGPVSEMSPNLELSLWPHCLTLFHNFLTTHQDQDNNSLRTANIAHLGPLEQTHPILPLKLMTGSGPDTRMRLTCLLQFLFPAIPCFPPNSTSVLLQWAPSFCDSTVSSHPYTCSVLLSEPLHTPRLPLGLWPTSKSQFFLSTPALLLSLFP